MLKYEFKSFQLSPISIDEIEPKLFLGSLAAAQNDDTLRKYKITHVLSLETHPLPQWIIKPNNLNAKFIQILDMPKSDILSHLDDAINFIEEGLSNGVVLVHCQFGVSRSATVVIAYIMKKYNLNLKDAIKKVKEKRPIIAPNAGFKYQLGLYRKMGCTINKNDKRYKMFRLSLAGFQMNIADILSTDFQDLIQPDPGLPHCQPEPNCYQCKNCRRVLACESNLILHKDPNSDKICKKLFFIEPLAWMNSSTWLKCSTGRLFCPKCTTKIGAFSWTTAFKCPCEVNVGPAFYLVPSKVDHTNFVQNVEVAL